MKVNLLVTIFISLFCSLGSSYFFDRFSRKKVGDVNLKKILSNHILDFSSLPKSTQKRLENDVFFANLLDRTVKRVSEKNNVTLFVRGALVSEAKDYTLQVSKEIKKEIEGFYD